MADKDKDKKDEEVVALPIDARINWFEDKVCSAFKVKADKWKKTTSLNENL
jgi:hypothetical protein